MDLSYSGSPTFDKGVYSSFRITLLHCVAKLIEKWELGYELANYVVD